MTLPVEQYFVLDPKQISHLGGNRFELTVPRINVRQACIEPATRSRVFRVLTLARLPSSSLALPRHASAHHNGAPGTPNTGRQRRHAAHRTAAHPCSPHVHLTPVTPSPLQIFNLWIEAFVEVSVNSFPDASSEAAFASSPSSSGSPLPLPLGPGSGPRVLLRAENCRITGSDAVESLRLDQRFAMRFVTELTWRSTAPTTSNGNGNGNGHAGSGSGGAVQQQQQQAQGEIRADSRLDVWSEVVQPFHLLPREVLVATCNGVLRGLMGSLLPLFVRMLAQDYQRWAGM